MIPHRSVFLIFGLTLALSGRSEAGIHRSEWFGILYPKK
jgi:hypothetical protein